MSFWYNVKRELEGSLGIVRKGLAEVLDYTEDLTKRGRLKLEIQGLKADVKDEMAELGGRVYQLAVEEENTTILEDPDVQKQFRKIAGLQATLEEKEKFYDQVGRDIDEE